MPHISLPEGVPGIVSLFVRFPDTQGPLYALAQTLLRGPSSLSPAEREMIAAYVSERNGCVFCAESHSAAARHLLGAGAGAGAGGGGGGGGGAAEVDLVRLHGERSPVGGKMRALLAIADRVRDGGHAVSTEDIARARAEGADDRAIHDTVLVAAAFCMYNRYVDGLATWQPTDPEAYREIGVELAERGYQASRAPAPASRLT
ncbi:MAG: hypothetical protein V7603_6650 [Micromonosporaceae bacterium]